MIEQSIVQGLTQGGISAIVIYFTFKYILPRIDRIESKIEDTHSGVVWIKDTLASRRRAAAKVPS